MRDNFPSPYSLSDARRFLRYVATEQNATIWAIWLDEDLIGALGIHPQKDVMRYAAEIGYWIAEPYWGRGITTQILREMVPAIFTHSELQRIYALVFESNPASEKVLQKAGFVYEGNLRKTIYKNEQLMDARVWSILREESL